MHAHIHATCSADTKNKGVFGTVVAVVVAASAVAVLVKRILLVKLNQF
jgi:hypothetical protein